MITVSIKFPPPSRYGYGVTGKIKITKMVFPPSSRYIQQLNQCYGTAGSERNVMLIFPKPLRYIQSLRYCDSADGKELTVTVALPKPLRYVLSLRYNCSVKRKEHRVTIAFPKQLLYGLQLLCSYNSSGHEYNTMISFQKQLRYIQKLHYDYKTKGHRYTMPLILNHVRNYQHAKFLYGYDTKLFNHTKLNFRYDYKNIVGTKLLFTFDRITRIETKWLWKHSVLVHSGWKIMARNTATGEVCELGFIDAEHLEYLLTNVELPEGDYEIFVLTSSLFWKDCRDRNIRMISVRNGKETFSLPNIYNLRSSISQGMTVIEWSSSQTETDDCRFAVWYSSEIPIDTTHQPNATIAAAMEVKMKRKEKDSQFTKSNF